MRCRVSNLCDDAGGVKRHSRHDAMMRGLDIPLHFVARIRVKDETKVAASAAEMIQPV